MRGVRPFSRRNQQRIRGQIDAIVNGDSHLLPFCEREGFQGMENSIRVNCLDRLLHAFSLVDQFTSCTARLSGKGRRGGACGTHFPGPEAASHIVAEEEGFEPPGEFPRQRFSRPPVSTTHPFLRYLFYLISPANYPN